MTFLDGGGQHAELARCEPERRTLIGANGSRLKVVGMRPALPSPPEDPSCRFTVWIARASAGTAADIRAQLQGLGVDIWLCDETFMPQRWPDWRKVVVADAARADDVAHDLPGRPDKSPPAAWRGGLAPGALRRVREHIERSLSERIDMRGLAELARLSTCHFSRAFRQSVGVPPHRYVMARRIAVAAGLIEQTDRALTDIALAVGFSDQSHFTRAFARVRGETPGTYRRRHR